MPDGATARARAPARSPALMPTHCPVGRQVPLLLPAPIARDLVARIEAPALEQALGQTQRHGGVIAPGAARQVEGPPPSRSPTGGKRPRAGTGSRRRAHRPPPVRAAPRGSARATARTAASVAGSSSGSGSAGGRGGVPAAHVRASARRSPGTESHCRERALCCHRSIQRLERLLARTPGSSEQAPDGHPGAADARAAVQVHDASAGSAPRARRRGSRPCARAGGGHP